MFNSLKYFISVIIICSCFNTPLAHSDSCSRNVQPIEKGQIANCTGFLFSPDAEEKAFKAVEISTLRAQENEILNRRLELYVKQSDALAREIARKQVTEDLYRGLYFVVGAVVTGFIAANVR